MESHLGRKRPNGGLGAIKIVLISVIFGFMFLAGGVSAGTVYVNGSNTGTQNGSTPEYGWQTIQAGIDDTNAGTGDIIYVSAGTYAENVVVNKSVNLRGAGVGLTIVTNASAGSDVIKVVNDSVNISGFTVEGAWEAYYASIHIKGANYTNISNNNVTGSWYGIHVDRGLYNTIENNTATLNGNDGILLNHSNYTTVRDNIAKNNSQVGSFGNGICLGADGGENYHNIIGGNTIIGNYWGIYLLYSYNITIVNNTVNSNSDYGIYIDYSDNNTLTNNTANSNSYGIYLETSSNNTISNNTANSNSDDGIYLESSSNYNTITDNNASGNDYGIYVDSTNNTISKNTASNNDYGIYIDCDGGSNTITNNTATSNTYDGIYLYATDGNTISNNNASSNTNEGIYLESSSSTNISGNTINFNGNYGIELYFGSNNNTVTNNNASGNDYGIYLDPSSNYNTLTNNIVSSNSVFGIELYSSSNNTIYNNLFNNTANTNFTGTVYPNDWNTTKQPGTNIIGGPNLGGNFWAYPNGTGYSENCTDSDVDGICDSNYTLASGNVDHLPLAKVEGQDMTACGTIDQPGYYRFGADITDSGAPTCINITSSDVILDGAGYNLTGNISGYGIVVNGSFKNITIKNIGIDNVTTGIWLNNTNVSGFTIANNTINSTGDGIYLTLQNICYNMSGTPSIVMGDLIVYNNTITAGGDGVYLDAEYLGAYMNSSLCTIGDFKINQNNISSSSYGIHIYDFEYIGYDLNGNSSFTMGSIEFNNNTINSSDDGIFFDDYFEYIGYDLNGNSSFTMGSIEFNNNTINSSNNGIYIDDYWEYWGYDMYDNSSFTMGSIEFNNNAINSSGYGIYLYELYEFGYNMNQNSSFTMGNIEFNDNAIDSGDDGIYLEYIEYFGGELYDDSSFTMGNIEFNRNTINSTYYGIDFYYISYFGYGMYDDSSFAMGSFKVNDNIINSGDNGIYFDDYFEYIGYDLNGNSSFTMGDVEFNNNTINSSNNGIYIEDDWEYWGYDMYDDSSFTMGNIQINNNTINSSGDGIYFYDLWYFGYNMNQNSSFTMGNIEFDNNAINASGYGIYPEYVIYDFGEDMYDDSSFTMGNITFNDNTITATGGSGIYIYEAEYIGYNLNGNSSFTMGNIEFDNNAINASSDGICIEYLGDMGYDMYDDSSFTMGNIQINNNTINSSGDGIYEYIDYIGDDLYDNSSFTMGNIEVNTNTINSSGNGIYIEAIENATISNNTIQNANNGIYLDSSSNNTITDNNASGNDYGIYLYNSSNNTIYNNIFNNTANTNFTGTVYPNDWNTTNQSGTNIIGGSYLGGNFWAYPNGTGFSETCTDADSDGICDSNYTLASGNIDYLPLTVPKPHLTLITPSDNQTILNSRVAFTFYAEDHSVSVLGYNLNIDGEVNKSGNATSGTNTTVTVNGLSDGAHNWSVKVWNDGNGVNTSEIRNFTVLTEVTIAPVIVEPIVNTTNGSGQINLIDEGVPEEIIEQTGVTGYEYTITTNGSTPVVNLSVNIFIEPPAEVSDITNVSGAISGFYYEIDVNDTEWFENVTMIQLKIYYNISTINLPSDVPESTLRPVRYTNGSWVKLKAPPQTTLADGTILYASGIVTSATNATHPYVWANLSNFSVYGIAGSVYGVTGSVYGVSGGISIVIQAKGITAIDITSNTVRNLIRQLVLMTRQFYITTSELAGVLGALDTVPTTPDLAEAVSRETWKPMQTLEGDPYTITSEHVLAKYPESAEVIIARGDLGVDSMASVAYARALGVPILLVKPDEIPEITNTTLEELGTNSSIIIGGPAAVSEEVADELPNMTRIWGQNRYETAVRIAEELMTTESVDTLVITDGLNPNMMSVAIAVKYNAPIIYVEGDGITADTRAFLEQHEFKKIVVVGVKEAARDEITAITS